MCQTTEIIIMSLLQQNLIIHNDLNNILGACHAQVLISKNFSKIIATKSPKIASKTAKKLTVSKWKEFADQKTRNFLIRTKAIIIYWQKKTI